MAQPRLLASTPGLALGVRGALERAVLLAYGPVYFLAIVLGNAADLGRDSVSALWPASGVALSALLLTRYRSWPLIGLLTLVVGAIGAQLWHHGPSLWRVALDPSDLIEALLGAFLVRRIVPDPLDPRAAVRYLFLTFLAVAVATAVGALLGAWMVHSVFGAPYWQAWRVWSCGDALGILMVAPVVLSWAAVLQRPEESRRAPRTLELTLLFVCLLTVTLHALGDVSAHLSVVDFPYLLGPFLIWAAWRFDTRVASTASIVVAAVAVGVTQSGIGPFSEEGATHHLDILALQAFLFTTTVSTLTLSIAVTARRRAEAAQRELEARLRHGERLETLGRLAGGIAHDFNNYLTVILGYSDQIAARGPDDERVRSAGERIHLAARRSSALVRQLLAFSRRQVLQPQAVDLNELFAEIRPVVEPLLGDVALDWQPGRIARVRVDPTQMEQIVLNLVVNARDALDGAGTITMATQTARVEPGHPALAEDLDAGDYVVLRVTDDGPGIPPEVLPRIFEPFFTTKEDGRGTGLGLATVHGIAHQSGGAVTVSSTPGAGATFEVFLPALAHAAHEERTPSDASAASGAKVLLVDDDDLVQDLSRTLLQATGYDVRCAADGAGAIGALREDADVQVLVTDMMLPDMRGIDLARLAVELVPALRVVYVSGYVEQGVFDPAELEPGAPLLAKPFTRAELLAAVQSALERRVGSTAS